MRPIDAQLSAEFARDRPPGFLHAVPLMLSIVGAAGALPTAAPGASATAMFLDEPARLMLFAACYGLAGVLVLRRWREALAASARLGLYWLLLIYMAASIGWSMYPAKVVINLAHNIGLTLVALSAAIYVANRGVREAFWPFALVTTAMLFLSVLAAKFAPDIGLGIYRRWQGVTSNPNHLGMIAVLGIWSALMWRLSQRGLILAGFVIGVVLLAMLNLKGADSKTSQAIAAGVMGLIAVFAGLSRVSPLARVMGFSLLMMGTSVAAIAIVAAAPQLLTFEGMIAAMGRDETLTGRTELWDLAGLLISERPIIGWGFDSLLSALTRVQMGMGQFHNGYLDLAVRGGAIGLVLTLLLILQATWTALRAYMIDWRMGAGCLAYIAALVIWNITEATLVREANELWTVFVVMLVVSRYWLARHSAPPLDAAQPDTPPRPVFAAPATAPRALV